MRLIDADKLNFEHKHYNKSQLKSILDFVDNQQTAYDVEKVVDELLGDGIFKECPSQSTINLAEAVRIVKAGLEIDDNVCKWEYKHPFGDFPSCKNVNYSISRDSNWKFCPYCGKK